MERPECCKSVHLEFLDKLRKKGTTNMYGAVSQMGGFGLDEKEKESVLLYWMDSFGNENR